MRIRFSAARARAPGAYAIALTLLACLASPTLRAQDQEDMRRILDQRLQRQTLERERELLKAEQDGARPTLTVDGQTYTIKHNANDVGRALYLALQQRQWDLAARFLDEYLTLPDRDPMLVHYAQGALARIPGRYREAERAFRALLDLQPDFLPGRLELARVLFEDQQDREAAALFEDIAAGIDATDPSTEGVRKTLDTFRQALENRSAWHGSFALGPAWSDNVNRTSASRTCLLNFEDTCFIERRTPDAIVSTGIDYDASLDKHWALHGHHGLYLRSLLFGQSYRDNSAYNELNLNTQAGYAYRSGRHNLALAPSFDYYALGNTALYGAWGVHGEWTYVASAKSLLKLEGDWKDLRYRRADFASNYDGALRSLYATWFRSLGPRWTVFGGVDVLDSSAPVAVNAYLQKGLRLGASLQWPEGFNSTLFASRRWRDYDAYSALLDARRSDREDNLTLIIKATRWSFSGFTPLLTLRRNDVRSNVDWLYTYDKNVVNLKLERAF